MTLDVECYSGYKADERPLRFTLAGPSAHTYQVKEILDRWHGVDYQCFKVHADDGNLYVLRHDEAKDRWTLDSFRRESQQNR
jgi:hypothetical protein